MWSVCLVFCDCRFHSVCPLVEKDKRIMEPSWWERLLRGKLDLVLMGGAMLNKSLILFFVDGQGGVPSCCLTWGQPTVDQMKIMMTSFKRSHAGPAALRAWDCAAAHRWPMPPRETPGCSWAGLSQSLLWGHCSFLLGPGTHKALFVPSKSLFPQSWVSSGGSVVGLMVTSSKRTYVYCTQSPCPFARPLRTYSQAPGHW